MKNYLFFFVAITSGFSFSFFAQSSDSSIAKSIKNSIQLKDNKTPYNKELTIVLYHVEERVAGNITTYNVSKLSQIDTYDLGPNNTRFVTPIYGRAKIKPIVKNIHSQDPFVSHDPNKIDVKIDIPTNPETIMPNNNRKYLLIDIIDIYERILEKGKYKPDKLEEMLKIVANKHYFNGDFPVAVKWYSQLFDLNTILEEEYYYRYAHSLLSIGQTEKGKEMMKLFNDKKMSKN